jgi:hypothetical protein
VSGVVRAAGNVPVAGARVVVLGPGLSAVTDADGFYSISGVTAAPAEGMSPLLSASKSGHFSDVEFANAGYNPISSDTVLDFTLVPLVPISVGEVIHGQSPSGEPVCSHWGYGSSPCQRYALTAPSSGTLEVALTASVFNFDVDIVGPNGSFVLYNASWRSPLRLPIAVEARSTYEIRVIGGWDPPRDFELTTSLR